ncbi:Phospholipase SGR2 [Linum grandiflorum]
METNPEASVEATPDLLRNTPSNIARLEDVIEHSEGRQKYLAQTGSPSDGGDVRWYFCKVPLALKELAASVPRAEVVEKGEYFRFGMRDSLAIEASFLQVVYLFKEEELLSMWWKEYAECSEGPRGRPSSSKKIDLEASRLFDVEEERVGVPVKGGLYEVPVRHVVFMVHGIGQRLEKSNLVDDVGTYRHITASLAERHLTSHQLAAQRVLFIPCQWRKGLKLSGEAAVEKITLDGVRGLRIMLGATAHDVLYYMSPIYCQDIINSVSNQLNCLYLKFLKRNPSYDGKVSIYGHSLGSVLSYDILCHQENLSSPFPMEWMYKEQPSTDAHDDSSMHDPSEEMNSSDEVQPREISNPVHADGAAEDIATTSSPSVQKVNGMSVESGQPEGVPHINNSGGILPEEKDGAGEDATLSGDGSVEGLENDPTDSCKADDVKEIETLKEEIELLKAKIAELESKSGTESKEIPSTKQDQSTDENALQSEPQNYTPYIKYTKLEFKVDTFFAVGSPLGVFLALRNIRIGIGKGQGYWIEENITEEIPACRQMFNIFHPFDPVAYRIEPLVCKEFIDKRPVIVPYHRGGKRLHIGFQVPSSLAGI